MRQPIVLLMPTSPLPAIAFPENLFLKWSGIARLLDIGQISYLQRKTNSNARKNHTFDAGSLCEVRRRCVIQLASAIAEHQNEEGLRDNSIYFKARSALWFIDWADENGYEFDLSSASDTLRVAAHWITFEKQRTAALTLGSQNSSANIQSAAIGILRTYFHDDSWGAELKPTKRRKPRTSTTAVPSRSDRNRLYATCKALFTTIANHVLSCESYPITVKGPFGENGTTTEIAILNGGKLLSESPKGYSRETGRPLSYEEILITLPKNGFYFRQAARGTAEYSHANFTKANLPRSATRLNHATFAALCFAAMFVATIGQNIGFICALDGGEEPDLVKVTKQNYRGIRWRARGKEVTVEVPLDFLPLLRLYTKLRSYLLEPHTSSALLLTTDHRDFPVRLPETFLPLLYKRLQSLRVQVPKLSARQLRAAKQDFAISNGTPEDASALMGHDIRTGIRQYSNGNSKKQREEISKFLERLEPPSLSPECAEDTESAVGGCSKFGSPVAMEHAPVEPKCRSSESCLFCQRNRIHETAEDLRKLLSCRFCLRELSMSTLFSSEERATYSKVLARLDLLIAELKVRLDATAFERCRADVEDDGNLHSFWSAKLDQLIALEMV
ncbi:hypothetical protein [Pseudorhodoferax sp. Leaf265]|uniref:hypothetical protein n=1 Tax=Pseudorhodoferax sp. Leaf265 TaxID=1736315 RepID=UPI0012E980A5|nr:hypothetical protein [Pseudorhodoferax sp. Leaf265]